MLTTPPRAWPVRCPISRNSRLTAGSRCSEALRSCSRDVSLSASPRKSRNSRSRFSFSAATQPRWPHLQMTPSGRMLTWLSSPAKPCAPVNNWPWTTIPQPIPSVAIVIRRKLCRFAPAPSRRSATTARFESFSIHGRRPRMSVNFTTMSASAHWDLYVDAPAVWGASIDLSTIIGSPTTARVVRLPERRTSATSSASTCTVAVAPSAREWRRLTVSSNVPAESTTATATARCEMSTARVNASLARLVSTRGGRPTEFGERAPSSSWIRPDDFIWSMILPSADLDSPVTRPSSPLLVEPSLSR